MLTIEQLHQFVRILHKKYPKINYGGCCVFASHIAQHLQHLFPTKIILFDSESADVDINQIKSTLATNSLVEWNAHNVYPGHVLVQFEYNNKSYMLDSRGVYLLQDVEPSFEYMRISGWLSVDEALELAEDAGWCSDFDRSNIPNMDHDIKGFFSQYIG